MSEGKAAFDVLPLTAAQAGMLFHVLEEPGATPYVAVLRCTLEGPLDTARFRKAMEDAVAARDAYRAGFVWEGVKQPVQAVRKEVELPWQDHDWTDRSEAETERALGDLVTLEGARRFDLKKAPLMQVQLIRHSYEKHSLIWTIHHLISDGWSTGVVLRDVMARYAGHAPAQPQPLQFRDYLVWLRRSGREVPDEAFWKDHLAGVQPTTLPLAPVAEPRAGQGHLEAHLGAELLAQVQAFARTARVTPNSFLSAAWAILLRHLVGRDDVVFGQTSAGRPTELPGADGAAGAFLNTLPLRTRVSPNSSVQAFAVEMESTQRAWSRHQFAALPKVQALAETERGTPLFDTLFVSEALAPMDLPPSDVTVADLSTVQSSNYALALLVTPQGDLRTELYFDKARLSETIAADILARYGRLVAALVANPSGRVDEVAARALMPKAEALPPSPYTQTILDQFLAHAERTPDAPAVSDGEVTLSYGTLAARAARIAAALSAAGVGRGDIVPVALERSVDSLAGFLAAWMVGAGYIPLDLTYPPARLQQILEEAAPRHILTSTDAEKRLPEAALATRVYIDALPAGTPAVQPKVGETAYVIFTSGSQGKPKGVVISHSALSHSTGAREGVYPSAPGVYLVLSSLAFDSSVPGLYWPLATGGHVVLAPHRAEQDIDAMGRLMARHEVTHSLCLPSLAQAFLPRLSREALASLNTLIVAGEAMPPALTEAVAAHAPGLMLFNEYGPTESTVWATASEITGQDGGPVPIGTPVPGTEASICDPDGTPLPEGFEGELLIAGPMLADGYLHQQDLTASRFAPRVGGAQERLYHTGDLGYRGADGQIYLLGRADDQVKIRGHRVELAETERIAQDLFDGALCVAFVTDGALAVAVECAEGVGPEDREAAFGARLPAPLVPRHVITAPELPRLPNGKIDRNALPALVDAGASGPMAEVPESELERQIAAIFADVLGLEAVPRDGNFFDLGGDSLATIAVYAKAREQGLDFAPTDIFEAQEVSALAHRILARSTNPVAHDSTRKLIHTNAGAEGTAVLLVHGTTALFNAVSRGLGEGHATGLAFSDYALGAETSLEHSVEDYAADVIKDLRTLKPTGPYVLCAYSAGAVIALEAARRLGDEVERLVLIDPAYQVLAADEGRITTAAGRKVQADTNRYLRNRRIRHSLRVAAMKALAPVMPRSEWRRRQLVRSAYVFALSSYRLHAHEGPVDVIVTSGNPALEEGGTWDSNLSQKTVEELALTHRDVISTPEGVVAVSSRVIARMKGR
ncbi:MAG: amino acid adenylation domain-containing protein [Pseudomonadota bacterium]